MGEWARERIYGKSGIELDMNEQVGLGYAEKGCLFNYNLGRLDFA